MTNARRSRCLGSMLACILNTNPVNFSSSGSTWRTSDVLGRGDGAISTNVSRSSDTPKLFSAEPKNTGCCSPARYFSSENSGYMPVASSRSSRNFDACRPPISSSSLPDDMSSISTDSPIFCFDAPENSFTFFPHILYMPLNSAPIPIGKLIGVTCRPSFCSTSSIMSNASRPSRSSLFTNTIIGMLRIRHT